MRTTLLLVIVLVAMAAPASALDGAQDLLQRGGDARTAWERCAAEGLGQAAPCGTTWAQYTPPVLRDAPRRCWSGAIAGYAWATDISGKSYVDGLSSDVDVAFADLYDKLDYAFMGYAEVRYDRWSFVIDATTLALDDSSVIPGIGGQADTRIEQTLLDFRLGYTFHRRQVGSARWGGCCYPRHLMLDGVLGVRYWNQRQKLTLDIPGKGVIPLDEEANWLDPYVGARFRWQFAKRWGLLVYGDVGGFDIGDASNLTWQFQTHVRFHITRGFFVALGYRALGIDRVTGSGFDKNGVDLTEHGPLLGLGFMF